MSAAVRKLFPPPRRGLRRPEAASYVREHGGHAEWHGVKPVVIDGVELYDIRDLDRLLGWVYIAVCTGYAKIGWTRDLEARMCALQQAAPDELSLVYSFVGTQRVEREWHRRFAEHRRNGEWFKIEGSLSDWLDNA